MKSLLKISVILSAFGLLYQCHKDEKPLYISIPDNNFINELIKQGIDIDGDSKISASEAARVRSINVSYTESVGQKI